MKLIKIILVVVAFPTAVPAQTATITEGILTVTSPQETVLLASPPATVFSSPKEVGILNMNQPYSVIGVERKQAGIGSQDVWLKVAPIDQQGDTETANVGWLLFGNTSYPEASAFTLNNAIPSADGLRTTVVPQTPQLLLEK